MVDTNVRRLSGQKAINERCGSACAEARARPHPHMDADKQSTEGRGKIRRASMAVKISDLLFSGLTRPRESAQAG